MIEIKVLNESNWQAYSAPLQELESLIEYPYGQDFFRIDHGSSYFGFFKRLGSPLFHVALENGRVIGCAAGVLREVPLGHRKIKTWYLCDLKVHPDFRGENIPRKLFRKNLFQNYLRCPRAYCLSMDPPDRENRVIKILKQLPFFPIKLMGKIVFFTLSKSELLRLRPELTKLIGPFSSLSLKGTKELILKSSGLALPLYHVQYGPLGIIDLKEPFEEGLHMMSALEGGPLFHLLRSSLCPQATASLLAYGMKKQDWNFILSSDV